MVEAAPVHRGQRLWRWLGAFLAVIILNAALTFTHARPTLGVLWSGELSVEIALLLLLLALSNTWFRATPRLALTFLSALMVVFALGRYGEVTPALHGRELTLYRNLPHVSAVVAAFARRASPGIVYAFCIGALVLLAVLYVVARWSLGQIDDTLRGQRAARLGFGLGAAILIGFFVVQHVSDKFPRVPQFSSPVSKTYAVQVARAVDALASSSVAQSVASSPPTHGGGVVGAGGSIPFPRLAWDVAGQNDRAGVIPYAQHMDIQIYGDAYETAAYSSTTRAAIIRSMVAGDGVVHPKVLQYVVGNIFDPGNTTSPSPGGTPVWAAQLNAMSAYWFLYRTDLPGSPHALTTDPSKPWMANPSCPNASFRDTNGNCMEAALARYADNFYRTGGSSHAAAALSGWFHDNFGTPPGCIQGDYQHNGSNLGGCDASNAATYLAGQRAWISWYRANAPGQFLMGNLTLDYLTHIGNTYSASPIYGALDAAMTEDALGPSSLEHWNGFEAMRTQTQLVAASVIHPEYNVAVHYNINYSNGTDSDFNASKGQAMRYGMCAVLTISNGTYTFFDQYTPGVWFDYFAVNPATGVALDYATSTPAQIGAARYWLGTPIDAIQTAPAEGKVYARRFRMPNGRTALVLVNPSANGGNSRAAPQTINLTAAYGGSWTHITASKGTNIGSNPQVDNGATVSSVTVPVGDGMILIQ